MSNIQSKVVKKKSSPKVKNVKKILPPNVPKWKKNSEFKHLPIFDVPYNYVQVTSERDCPPGIFTWVTCEQDQVYLVIRELKYDIDKTVHKIKLNPVTKKGNAINSWNGIKSKN